MAQVQPGADFATETLLKEEGGLMSWCGAVTTITFFDGPAPVDHLRERFQKIVEANPWLCGRLVKGGKDLKGRWGLAYDPKPGKVSEEFFSVSEPGKYKVHGVPYENINKAFKGSPVIVKGGQSTVNKTGPKAAQTTLTIIPDGDKWALVLSISHTFADGFTYYQIYNMLSSAVEIRALSLARKESFSTDKIEASGKQESGVYTTVSFTLNVLGTMIFGGKPKARCLFVDKDKVAEAKTKAKVDGDAPFVSTNDLLTSAWAKATKAQLLEMAINFRNRLKGISNDDAGNYEWVVFFQEEDCERPGQIRKALSTPGTYKRCGRNPPRPLRSGCARVRSRYSLITNWATFAEELEMPGCKQRLHLPIWNTGECPCEMAYVFRATKDETGLLMFSRKLKDADLEAAGIFGGAVDPIIFPQ